MESDKLKLSDFPTRSNYAITMIMDRIKVTVDPE
jgi:hypothetical protein